MEKSSSGKKRPREVHKLDYNTKCICCDKRCDEAHKKIKQYNPKAPPFYLVLPSNPKPLTSRSTPGRLAERAKKEKRRARYLAALPGAATTRVNDERYSEETKFRISSTHYPSDITDLATQRGKGGWSLPNEISAELASKIHSEKGLAYTPTDKFEDGTYVPLPNVPIDKVISQVGQLEKQHKSAASRTPITARKGVKTR